jgi:hypothetical protein
VTQFRRFIVGGLRNRRVRECRASIGAIHESDRSRAATNDWLHRRGRDVAPRNAGRERRAAARRPGERHGLSTRGLTLALPLSDVVVFAKCVPPGLAARYPNLQDSAYNTYKLLVDDEIVDAVPSVR